MKYLILITVLISGCILEPRPEEDLKDFENLKGSWIDVQNGQVITVYDYGQTSINKDTLIGKVIIDGKIDGYYYEYYRDTLKITVTQGLYYKFVRFGEN